MAQALTNKPTYLDFSATTPIDPRVFEVMKQWFLSPSNSGSRTHNYGKRAKEAVESARQCVANAAAAEPEDVVFTSGATESNNIALLGLADHGRRSDRMHIISTAIEHKAVLEPLGHLEKQGFEVELLPVSKSGAVDVDSILNRVRPDTLVVSVMHANNETGVIQPVVELGKRLRQFDAFFHVDAAQTFGKLNADFLDLDADLVSISSHKVYGPQGIGALVVKKTNGQRLPIHSIQFGGGQERGLRPGTLPVPLAVGFGEAARLAKLESAERARSLTKIRNELFEILKNVDYELNGTAERCLPNVLNVRFPGIDAEALMMHLRDEIAVSNGSACTSDDFSPSHVLIAMGLDEDAALESIRFSWGPETVIDDVEGILATIKQLTF